MRDSIANPFTRNAIGIKQRFCLIADFNGQRCRKVASTGSRTHWIDSSSSEQFGHARVYSRISHHKHIGLVSVAGDEGWVIGVTVDDAHSTGVNKVIGEARLVLCSGVKETPTGNQGLHQFICQTLINHCIVCARAIKPADESCQLHKLPSVSRDAYAWASADEE
jgi:hypothetical protein